jgi:predicted HicB family RNase H-like nuclease
MRQKKQDGFFRFQFRTPPDIHAFLQREAEINGSSLNSEVIRSIRVHMSRKLQEEQREKAAG